MQLTISKNNPTNVKTDLLVIIDQGDTPSFARGIPQIERALKDLRKGLAEKRLRRPIMLRDIPKVAATNIICTSTRLVRYLEEAGSLRVLGARAMRTAKELNLSSVAFALSGDDIAATGALLVEGAAVGAYTFEEYRQKRRGFLDSVKVTLIGNASGGASVRKSAVAALATAASINRCRNLVNEPGSKVYPEIMAAAGRRIAKEFDLTCQVFDERRLKREGYRGLLQVGAGSKARPPRLIVLKYRPARIKKGTPHLALVGKGLTFDTGGISLKPGKNMWMMKGDMAGGAACLYAMEEVARRKPSIPVTCIVPSSENYPGPDAQKPGDIFIAKNGKSIHVDNTDAEGRLILTDGLFHAGRVGATHVVDVATLTGSCVRSLGMAIAGIMGTAPELIRTVIETGQASGEGFWELPLVPEYKEMILSPIADVNNIGGPYAGAITAGLFLKEFVPDNTAWAHLDVAGTFIAEKTWRHFGPGATGFGVKTLSRIAERIG